MYWRERKERSCQTLGRPFDDEEIGGLLLIFRVLLLWCISPTLRILPCIKTLVEQVVCLKRFITIVLESSEL